MRTWKKSVVALAALALMGSMSVIPARAADTAATTGSVKGTVSKDGKPAANVAVRLIKAADAPAGKQLAAGDAPAADKPAGGKAGKGGKAARPGRAAAVAETTTDDKGAFTLANVAVGDYVVMAGDRASGSAGREKVSVTAGGTASVTVSLKERKAGKAGA